MSYHEFKRVGCEEFIIIAVKIDYKVIWMNTIIDTIKETI